MQYTRNCNDKLVITVLGVKINTTASSFSAMVEGLEVVIRYHGAKYDRVAFPKSDSSEFAILKKDLAHLRVHSPSQKNVRRVNGSFVLHWPNASVAALSKKTLADSLYTRWIKLCSDDPQALKLRKALSIESITMKQDGVLLYATARAVVSPKNIPPESLVVTALAEIEPTTAATPGHASPMEPPPPPPQPPPQPETSAVKYPPTSPRAGRQQLPHLKRRKSTPDGPPKQTRQKLDTPERHALVDTPESMEISPPRESGELTPLATPYSARSAASASGTSPSGGGGGGGGGARLLIPRSVALRYASSASSSGSGSHRGHQSPLSLFPPQDASRRRDHDVNRLTRELWDTRRELAAMRAREQVILGDLGRFGAQIPRVEVKVEVGAEGAGAGGEHGVSREDLQALEAELSVERARRVRAERALNDVERECRAPFVVPALFQAFVSISELSG